MFWNKDREYLSRLSVNELKLAANLTRTYCTLSVQNDQTCVMCRLYQHAGVG